MTFSFCRIGRFFMRTYWSLIDNLSVCRLWDSVWRLGWAPRSRLRRLIWREIRSSGCDNVRMTASTSPTTPPPATVRRTIDIWLSVCKVQMSRRDRSVVRWLYDGWSRDRTASPSPTPSSILICWFVPGSIRRPATATAATTPASVLREMRGRRGGSAPLASCHLRRDRPSWSVWIRLPFLNLTGWPGDWFQSYPTYRQKKK